MSLSILKRSVFVICAVALQMQVGTAYAKPSSDENKSDLQQIQDLKYDDAKMVLDVSEVYSDRLLKQEDEGTNLAALYQDKNVTDILDHLEVRIAPFAIVKGQPGSGKTAVINEALLKLIKDKKAVILKTSMRNFMPGLKSDMATYVDVSRKIGKRLERPVILYFTECQHTSDYNVSVFNEESDRSAEDAIPIILEVDDISYGRALKGHPSFTSHSDPIQISSPKPAEIVTILKQQRDMFEKRYQVNITDEVADAVVDIASDYRRDVAEPRRSLQLMEMFMIAERRKAPTKDAVTPTKQELYHYVADKARLPVLPQNEQEFADYMQKVKSEIKAELVGQDHMVDGVVDQFIAALTSRTRQHSVALMLGPTGVGKTLIGEKLAEKFYGDKTRFLELDMTQFTNELSLNSLFGAANGVQSADKEKGALCDFFDGPGKGGGIVVMNEIEEMSSQALTRFMELFDKGEFRGGDGKVRYVGRTLFILTSNKNADKILSYDAIRGMTQAELDRRLSLITQEQMKKAFTEKSSYTEDDSKQVKPAVLERVDHLYFASPLLKPNAVKVAKIEVDRFVRSYEKQGTSKLKYDSSVPEVLTSAFYNEVLGSRQIRTAVNQYLSKAIQSFKAKYGYGTPSLEISAALHPFMKTVSYVTVKDPATGNELTIDGPRIPVENRLLDKDFRDRLINLEKNINSEIFGQEESVKAVASALMARYLKGGRGRPASGFLFGVTGSGKSEIAKLTAKYLFDSPSAVGIFDMGGVQTDSALWNIFSPPKGIVGSNQPGELERFLTQYPDGGVLLFDEMSNAGNIDKKIKETIAKQFYTMMEEGYWKSPSGKVFDVRNHLILFTGNDGEEIFKGLTTDTFLNEAYKEAVKKPDMMKQLLIKAGFTQAFIGRLAFIQLMRPTLSETKVLIARKMLRAWRNEVQQNQPIDITWGDDFEKEIGLLMFSPTTGARSYNDFISDTMGQLIGQEALKTNWDEVLQKGHRMHLDLTVSTIKSSKPFYDGDMPEKTEAILHSKLTIDGRQISTASVDFTKKANFKATVHRNIAAATAYHEMGHMFTSYTSVTGRKPIKVTIEPERVGSGEGVIDALGYAAYRNIPRKGHANREYLIKMAAGLYAGSHAENMYSGDWNGGRSNDVENAGKLIRRMVLDAHMDPEFDSVHAYVGKDGDYMSNIPNSLKEKFETYIQAVDREAKDQAEKTLKERWHAIDAGSRLLLELGSINERQIQVLIEEADRLQPKMDQLIAEGRWSKEAAAAIGQEIDLEKVKAAGKSVCEADLEGGAQP